MPRINKKNFKIEGLNCQSCKTLIETEVGVLEGINKIEVDYQTGNCWVEFDEDKILFSEIVKKIESFDYKIPSSSPVKEIMNEKEVVTQIPSKTNFIIGFLVPLIVIGFIGGYFLLQRFGVFQILAKLNESNVSYGLIFLIGFLASFHCIGMCGGLVVTYSAGIAAKGNQTKGFSWPHFQYNFGRLISYTTIGGVLGSVGSFFGINPVFSGIMMLFAGGFMILMAISLLTNFKILEKMNFRMPQFIARFLFSQKHSKKPKGPFIIGLLNGLMPCGPLQAMQLYALGTGSFSRGALSLAVYALGTIPLMFGFGTFISFLSNSYIKKIMKFSGVVVAILALIMINRGLANFGWGFSFGSLNSSAQENKGTPGPTAQYQTAKMELTFSGYRPNVLYVKKGIPVRWVIDVKQMSGCTNEIVMPSYNIRKKLQYGENIIEFTPTQAGEIKFSCWMQMVWGKFIVT